MFFSEAVGPDPVSHDWMMSDLVEASREHWDAEQDMYMALAGVVTFVG